MIPISAIICTYNRSKMLAGALESLVQQSLDTKEYEIMVVDNASMDQTPRVVRTFQEKYSEHTISRIYEPKQGLGYARNAALKHAHGKYVAYLDDDARAKRDWLKKAVELFETIKPTPICVGGPIWPSYRDDKPAWFKDGYEIRSWGDKARFLNKGEEFSGSNMIFTKGLIEKYGGFDERVGMEGRHLSFGEESSLFEKIWKYRGDDTHLFYYCPKLIVYHSVPGYKMTVSYQLRRRFAQGQAWQLRQPPKSICCKFGLSVREFANIVWFCLRGIARRREYDRFQSWMVECFSPAAYHGGRLLQVPGLMIRLKSRVE